MKKTLVLVTIVLAMMAAPIFAEATVSGEFDYSAMINGDEVAGEFDKAEINIVADIDDNNVFKMEIEDKVKGENLTGSSPEFSHAKVITDWSGVLGIDEVGIETTFGYSDFGGGDNHYITGYEFDNYGGTYTDMEAGAKMALSFAEGMVNPYVAYMFESYDKTDDAGAADDAAEVLMGATVNFAPFWADVYYLTAKDGHTDGVFGTEVYVGLDLGDGMMLDLVGSFQQDMADVAAGEESIYGFGAAFYLDALKVAVGLEGNDDQAARFLGLDVAYGVSEMVTLRAGSAFYLGDESENALVENGVADEADAFLNLTLMAEIAASDNLSYTVGYVVSDGMGKTARFVPGAETVAADGGAFVGCAVNF